MSPAGRWADEVRTRPAMARPPTIVRACQLMVVGAVLSAIGALVSALSAGTVRDALEDDASVDLTADQIDTYVTVSVVGGIVFGLIAVGLWLWMARANGQGKDWARIVASVLGGLNILSTLLALAQGATPLSLVMSAIGLALAGYILWLLWRPESTHYYEVMSRT